MDCDYFAWETHPHVLLRSPRLGVYSVDLDLVFAPIIIQSEQRKLQIFRRFIGVDWLRMNEDRFHMKSTKDLKSKYKPGPKVIKLFRFSTQLSMKF